MRKYNIFYRIRKVFRYPLSTCYVIVGLMVAFFMIFDGLSIYNKTIEETNEQREMQYFETTEVMVDNVNNEQLNTELFETTTDVDINLATDSCIDGANGNVKTDIIVQNVCDLKVSIKKGRLPNKEEVSNGEHVLIIKSSLLDCVFTKDGKDYINMNGEDYKVVGIMGTTGTDGLVLIYSNCIAKEMRQEVFQKKSIDVMLNSETDNTYQAYSEIKNKILNKFSDIKVSGQQRDTKVSVLDYAMENSSAGVVLFIYLFSIANCIIVSEFWIEQRKMEVAIKKAFGYSNLKIVKNIFSEMFLNVVISGVICAFLQLGISDLVGNLLGIEIDINVRNVGIILVIAVVTTLFIIMVPIRQIVKVAPAQAIVKGGR